MKLKGKVWPGDVVNLAVVTEDDGTTFTTVPLWRVIDGFLQLCHEDPELDDKARLIKLAEALESQAQRLREAARNLP
jgi:hypothetical protein